MNKDTLHIEKTAEFMERYSKCLRMAAQHNFTNTQLLIKYRLIGGTIKKFSPIGDVGLNVDVSRFEYQFAVTIKEGKPVFPGDYLFNKNGAACQATELHFINKLGSISIGVLNFSADLTWEKPNVTKPFNITQELSKVLKAIESHPGYTSLLDEAHKVVSKLEDTHDNITRPWLEEKMKRVNELSDQLASMIKEKEQVSPWKPLAWDPDKNLQFNYDRLLSEEGFPIDKNDRLFVFDYDKVVSIETAERVLNTISAYATRTMFTHWAPLSALGAPDLEQKE